MAGKTGVFGRHKEADFVEPNVDSSRRQVI